jgi:CheY-like chemotaxis protein
MLRERTNVGLDAARQAGRIGGRRPRPSFQQQAEIRRMVDAHKGGVAAVALTAYARSEDRTKAIRAGFQNHWAKPVEPAELLAVLQSLVNPRSKRQ